MNIVIISTFDIKGGAAKAAYRLHNAFLHKNIKSTMLVKKKETSDLTVVQAKVVSEKFKNIEKIVQNFHRELVKSKNKENGFILTSMLYPGYNIENLDIINNADVINIHWTRQFLWN